MSRQKRRARAKKDIPPVVRALMRSRGVPIRSYKKHEICAGRLVVTTMWGTLWDGGEVTGELEVTAKK